MYKEMTGKRDKGTSGANNDMFFCRLIIQTPFDKRGEKYQQEIQAKSIMLRIMKLDNLMPFFLI